MHYFILVLLVQFTCHRQFFSLEICLRLFLKWKEKYRADQTILVLLITSNIDMIKRCYILPMQCQQYNRKLPQQKLFLNRLKPKKRKKKFKPISNGMAVNRTLISKLKKKQFLLFQFCTLSFFLLHNTAPT